MESIKKRKSEKLMALKNNNLLESLKSGLKSPRTNTQDDIPEVNSQVMSPREIISINAPVVTGSPDLEADFAKKITFQTMGAVSSPNMKSGRSIMNRRNKTTTKVL